MAVVTEHQRKGFGSALIKKGLEQCSQLNNIGVVVLGHPLYYQRFGFSPASGFVINSEYDVSDEVFMVAELDKGVLNGKSGAVSFHAVFSEV